MVTTTVLPSGLRVAAESGQARGVVAVCVRYGVGSLDEVRGSWGMSHLCEHLMFQGTTRTTANEMVETLEAGGGEAAGVTGYDATFFTDIVPTALLPTALWFEIERMASVRAALTAERVANQLDVVRNERRDRYETKPVAMAWERVVRAAVGPHHPAAHPPIGDLESLRTIAAPACQDFLGAHFTPGNAVVSIVGDIEPDEVTTMVAGLLVDAPAGRPRRARRFPAGERTGGPLDSTAETVRAGDSVLRCWPIPPHGSREADLCRVAMNILQDRARLARRAGGVVGRLRFEVVEISRTAALAMLRVAVSADAQARTVMAEVDEALADLAIDEPRRDEIQASCARLYGDRLRRRDHLGERANDLAWAIASGVEPGRQASSTWLEQVTGDEIRRMVSANFPPGSGVWTVA